MTSQAGVATPFARQGSSQLSASAPEFVAGLGRSRTNSSLKAKDSVSSMTETESSEAKTCITNGPLQAADTPEDRSDNSPGAVSAGGGEAAVPSATALGCKAPAVEFPGAVRLASEGGSSTSKTDASRTDAAASRPPASRNPRNGAMPPAAQANGTAPSQRSRPRPSHQQQAIYPESSYPHGMNGQPVLMNGTMPGHFYAPGPYGQMYPVPAQLPMGVPQRGEGPMGQPAMMYPPQHPYMMPHSQWPPYQLLPSPMLPADQYGRGGYPHHLGVMPMHTGFYPVGYEEQFMHPHAVDPRYQRPVPSHASPNSGSPARNLNAAAQGWSPEDRSNYTRHAAVPLSGLSLNASRDQYSSLPEEKRSPERDAPGHSRPLSTSSSESQKGHRRMVSVPIDFSAVAAEPSEQPGIAVPKEKEKSSSQKRKGHRRQTSLPTATDMERLREGGHRRGRHSRSDSLASNSRSSALLEEFKSTRDEDRKWTLADVKSHIIEFCKDQAGSRFIQQALENPQTPPEQFDWFRTLPYEPSSSSISDSLLFKSQVREFALEARPRFGAMMEDVFGNYVIQKLLERAGPTERLWIAERICSDSQRASVPNRAVALSRQQYGCRVVQKALEVLELDEKIRIMEQLLENTLDLVADQNGNHVIQKCIECIKPTIHIKALINELLSGKETRTIPTLRGSVVPLSQHTYGCRVVQRVLEHCDDADIKKRFMTDILKDVLNLSTNIYSNYVIQHVLEFGEPDEKDRVLQDLFPHIMSLSRDKFASNVVERLLKHGSPAQRRSIIEEFLRNENFFVQMMKDDYGNYVCFSAYEFAEADQKALLCDVIKRTMAAVRRTSFGKNFHSKLAERHPESFGGPDFGIQGVSKTSPLKQTGAQHFRGRTPTARQLVTSAAPVTPPRVEAPALQPNTAATITALQESGAAQSLKPEDASKYPSSGQVSVMADGANPPVHTPMPTESSRQGSAERQVSRTASQESAHLLTQPAAVSIEG